MPAQDLGELSLSALHAAGRAAHLHDGSLRCERHTRRPMERAGPVRARRRGKARRATQPSAIEPAEDRQDRAAREDELDGRVGCECPHDSPYRSDLIHRMPLVRTWLPFVLTTFQAWGFRHSHRGSAPGTFAVHHRIGSAHSVVLHPNAIGSDAMWWSVGTAACLMTPGAASTLQLNCR